MAKKQGIYLARGQDEDADRPVQAEGDRLGHNAGGGQSGFVNYNGSHFSTSLVSFRSNGVTLIQSNG